MLKTILFSFFLMISVSVFNIETLIAYDCVCTAWLIGGECGYWGPTEVTPIPVEFPYPDPSCGGDCYGNAKLVTCESFY